MAFNHYSKIQRILSEQPAGWCVVRINEPTVAQNFRGEKVQYDHYYRVYSASNQPIKFCKFQKLDKFASIMRVPVEEIPIIDS